MDSSKVGEWEWLRVPCDHDWRIGPVTDRIPAVCIRCWEYTDSLDWDRAQRCLHWTRGDYLSNKDEVERRFFNG